MDEDADELSPSSLLASFISSINDLGVGVWILILLLLLSVFLRGNEYYLPAAFCDEAAHDSVAIGMAGISASAVSSESLASSYYEIQAKSSAEYEWSQYGTTGADVKTVKAVIDG